MCDLRGGGAGGGLCGEGSEGQRGEHAAASLPYCTCALSDTSSPQRAGSCGESVSLNCSAADRQRASFSSSRARPPASSLDRAPSWKDRRPCFIQETGPGAAAVLGPYGYACGGVSSSIIWAASAGVFEVAPRAAEAISSAALRGAAGCRGWALAWLPV